MIDRLNMKGYNGFSFTIPSITELKEIFAIAAPVFITMVSKVTFFGFIIYFATSMGTYVVAAHQVLVQIFSMCSIWGEPLCQTAQSFMPDLLYGVNRNLVKARSLLGATVGIFLGAVAMSIPWLYDTLEMHLSRRFVVVLICGPQVVRAVNESLGRLSLNNVLKIGSDKWMLRIYCRDNEVGGI